MVVIVQCLCPARHCVLALGCQDKTRQKAEEMLRCAFASLLQDTILNARCGICGSTDLRFEAGATIYHTLEQAEPELRRLEAEQVATRAALDAAGRTYDAGGSSN